MKALFQGSYIVNTTAPPHFRNYNFLQIEMHPNEALTYTSIKLEAGDNYRAGQHETVVYEHLPSQAVVHFIKAVQRCSILEAFKIV